MFGARNSNLLHRITIPLIICCLITVVLCVHTAAALPGSGTQQDPWRIESLADFDEFAAYPIYWAGFTRLETDVNLAGRTYTTAVIAPDTSTSSGFQGTKFTGVFDGNEHIIRNAVINMPSKDYVGLFGYIGTGGQIRNLGVEDVSIVGAEYVGGLVGDNDQGSISNCYSTGSVSGNSGVGGLVGYNCLGSISNCYSTGSVSGYWSVGVLVGENYGSVLNCYSTGDVSGHYDVGGLVGRNLWGSVSNCYSTGSVSGTGSYIGGLVGGSIGSVSNCYSTGDVSGTGSYIGGLVGYNLDGSVSICYSTGDVSGKDRVGGLVGLNYGTITNCYSTGIVSGEQYVGGLVGYSYGTISNCYSTGNVIGEDEVGGLAGRNGGSISNCFWDTDTQTHGVTKSIGYNEGTVTNVAGLTTAQMQTRSTFTDAGWDFVEIWLINDGATYPVLRQEIRSDLNGDGGVDMQDFAIFADHWLKGTGN